MHTVMAWLVAVCAGAIVAWVAYVFVALADLFGDDAWDDDDAA